MIILNVLQATQIKTTHAATVPSLIYKNDRTTLASSTFFLDTVELSMEHIILITCICNFIVLIIWIIYSYNFKTNKTIIMAEFTNGKSCVLVPLRKQDLCPTYWNITIPKHISIISIQGLWSPRLSMDWDQFTIVNNLNEQQIIVQSQFRISMLKSRQIRRILSTTYCVYFHVQHQNLLIPLK